MQIMILLFFIRQSLHCSIETYFLGVLKMFEVKKGFEEDLKVQEALMVRRLMIFYGSYKSHIVKKACGTWMSS